MIEDVYEQVHKDITTAMQTGEFWTMWDNDVYQEALLTIYTSMTKWKERTIIGEA
tara:strand:- start:61 stop:225 length:165 start_codon:yes stop_codon:yes gene_type:complete